MLCGGKCRGCFPLSRDTTAASEAKIYGLSVEAAAAVNAALDFLDLPALDLFLRDAPFISAPIGAAGIGMGLVPGEFGDRAHAEECDDEQHGDEAAARRAGARQRARSTADMAQAAERADLAKARRHIGGA